MPSFFCTLLGRLSFLVVAGLFFAYIMYRLSLWWGCRRGRRRLRAIEQDLATEIQTNGSHVRSLSAMFKSSPNDSGVFRSLDE